MQNDIDIKATIRTTADNSGAQEVEAALDALTDKSQSLTEVTQESGSTMTAALAEASDAVDTLTGTYSGLSDKTVEITRVTQEFSHTGTTGASAYASSLDNVSLKMAGVASATKEVAASKEDISGVITASEGLKNSLIGVQKQQERQTISALSGGRQISQGINALRGGLGGVISRLLSMGGYVGIVIGGIQLLTTAWKILGKTANETDQKRITEIKELNGKLQEQAQIMGTLRSQIQNANAQKDSSGLMDTEQQILMHRNSELDKMLKKKMDVATFDATMANDEIELKKIDLARKYQENLISEIEYKKQDAALTREQAENMRKLAEETAKLNVEATMKEQRASSKVYSKALQQKDRMTEEDILTIDEMAGMKAKVQQLEVSHGIQYNEIRRMLPSNVKVDQLGSKELIGALNLEAGRRATEGDKDSIDKINSLIKWVETKKDPETKEKEDGQKTLRQSEFGVVQQGFTPDENGLKAYWENWEKAEQAAKETGAELTRTTQSLTEAEDKLTQTRAINEMARKKEAGTAANEEAALEASAKKANGDKQLEMQEKQTAAAADILSKEIEKLKENISGATTAVKMTQEESRSRMTRLKGKNNPGVNQALDKMGMEDILQQTSLDKNQTRKLTSARESLSKAKWKDEEARRDLLDMVNMILSSYEGMSKVGQQKQQLEVKLKQQDQLSKVEDQRKVKKLSDEVYKEVVKQIKENERKAKQIDTHNPLEARDRDNTLGMVKGAAADGKVSTAEKRAIAKERQMWAAQLRERGANDALINSMLNALDTVSVTLDQAAQKAMEQDSKLAAAESRIKQISQSLGKTQSQFSKR